MIRTIIAFIGTIITLIAVAIGQNESGMALSMLGLGVALASFLVPSHWP